MSERYLKLLCSEDYPGETEYLLTNFPNAFLLLTLIAKRARRISNLPDGLKIGECYVGDHKSCGLTRQQYRTALQILINRKHIEKIETCRTRKKSTTGSTTEGTKVKLLSSIVYDINYESINHRSNHRSTTDQPRTRTKKNEEDIRLKRNVTKEKVSENSFSSVAFPFLEKKEEQQIPSENENSFPFSSLNISDKCITRWRKKYGDDIFYEALDGLHKGRDSINNHEAWMEKTLQLIANYRLNKKFIEQIISKHNIDYLDFRKNYCVDIRTQNDYQFSLPHSNFVAIINQKLETNEDEIQLHDLINGYLHTEALTIS